MNVRIPKLFLAFLALALALCACSAKEAAFQTAEEAGEALTAATMPSPRLPS